MTMSWFQKLKVIDGDKYTEIIDSRPEIALHVYNKLHNNVELRIVSIVYFSDKNKQGWE